MRFRNLLVPVAALTLMAACEQATDPVSPDLTSSHFSRGGTPGAPTSTQTGVMSGNPQCSDLNASWLGYKLEPGSNGTFSGPAGTTITITNYDGQKFNFSISGGTATLAAIIVKGGPMALVYQSPGTSGINFTTAINPNSGKPYGISNIQFCLSTTPPAWTIEKEVVGYWLIMNQDGSMSGHHTTNSFNLADCQPAPAWAPNDDCIVWVEYRITVNGPDGQTATVTDDIWSACNSFMNGLYCDWPPEQGSVFPKNITADTSFTYIADFKFDFDKVCGKGTKNFVNTAQVVKDNQVLATDQATFTFNTNNCPTS